MCTSSPIAKLFVTFPQPVSSRGRGQIKLFNYKKLTTLTILMILLLLDSPIARCYALSIMKRQPAVRTFIFSSPTPAAIAEKVGSA
jgi:hypothetical protein